MLAGCPVLISDQTPWQELENEGVGWSLPLNCIDSFKQILSKCIEMDQDTHSALSNKSRLYALRCIGNTGIIEQNRKMFLDALDNNSA